MMRRTLLLAAAAWVCATGTLLQSSAVMTPAPPLGQAPGTAVPSASAHDALLSKYCVTCHNERLKTGGFVLDVSSLGNAGAAAESWEKVVRKLRANAMPPAGAPRPDAAA
ncbi:MAG TPA: c-type cytochrome, partial [Vicinamibacterales bacterium]|nr:c-type cytochrome [Vicinamibacterales bacterium]